MKEEDYNKWLEAKSEVEHFDKLDDDVKKMIYDIEQTFYDGEEELNLSEIIIEKKEAYFDWTGFEEAVESVKEDYECDKEEAERIAGYSVMDSLIDILNDYTQHFDDWDFGIY